MMALARRAAAAGLRGLTSLLCRVDDAQLSRVPDQGPLIIITNHVGLVEIPLLYTHLQPRPLTGFVAAVRWRNRLLAWLLDLFEGIPLHRGEADIAALREGLKRLQAGQIVVIMPEGTRSRDGRLQKGHAGVVLLALRSGAPVLPVVHHGSERLADNLRRGRRTDFRFLVGRPFTFSARGARVTRAIRQQMVDEAMYQMAALLPSAYRGAYSDLIEATQTFLAFPEE
jgi:1-acyl-sn-glycerol-3-phosphate acyltransferase